MEAALPMSGDGGAGEIDDVLISAPRPLSNSACFSLPPRRALAHHLPLREVWMLQLAAGLEAGWERQMEMANLVTGSGLAAAGLDLQNHLASATGDSGCPPMPPAEKRLAPCTLPARRMVKPGPGLPRGKGRRPCRGCSCGWWCPTMLPAPCLQSPLRTATRWMVWSLVEWNLERHLLSETPFVLGDFSPLARESVFFFLARLRAAKLFSRTCKSVSIFWEGWLWLFCGSWIVVTC